MTRRFCSFFLVVSTGAGFGAAYPGTAEDHRNFASGRLHVGPGGDRALLPVTIGAVKQADPENPKGVSYVLSATQFIEVLPLPPIPGINRMDHAALNTADAEGMRKYLAAKGWKTPAAVTKGSDGSRWFAVNDPEGNKIQFVQPAANAKVDAPNAIGHHVIHVGFLVHSREAEDKFYRELLGFRPYWYGGMTDDKVDWVSQQVPDGHDWLEYMMSGGPGDGHSGRCRSRRWACSTTSPSAKIRWTMRTKC